MEILIELEDQDYQYCLDYSSGKTTIMALNNASRIIKAVAKGTHETRLKADMVSMLEDLKQDFIAEAYGIEMDCTNYVVNVADIDKVIQQKIDALKESEPQESEEV